MVSVGEEDRVNSATISARDRITQLFTPPILPDHPLYVFGMIIDRAQLTLSPLPEQFYIKLRYADTRLATAQALISRGRLALALSTLTKAEKYLLGASTQLNLFTGEDRALALRHLANKVSSHKAFLTAIKPSFSDSARATIDSLIEQITVIETAP